MRCSIQWRIGGSATGVLITDNYHKYRAVMALGSALIPRNTTAKN